MTTKSKIYSAVAGALLVVSSIIALRGDANAQIALRPPPSFPRQSELFALRVGPDDIASIQSPSGTITARLFTISVGSQNRLPVILSTNDDFFLYKQGGDGLYRFVYRYDSSAASPLIGHINPGFVLEPGNYALEGSGFGADGDLVVATGFWAIP